MILFSFNMCINLSKILTFKIEKLSLLTGKVSFLKRDEADFFLSNFGYTHWISCILLLVESKSLTFLTSCFLLRFKWYNILFRRSSLYLTTWWCSATVLSSSSHYSAMGLSWASSSGQSSLPNVLSWASCSGQSFLSTVLSFASFSGQTSLPAVLSLTSSSGQSPLPTVLSWASF